MKAAELKAMRPWGRRLPPRVSIDFDHTGRTYRIQKQFLDGAASSLHRLEGESWRSFMTGDEADGFLREILKCTPPGSGMAQREKHWGLAQVLWTTQGKLELPGLASTVVESIQRSVGAQLSAGGTAIEKRILERYLEFFTPAKGQLKRSAPVVLLAEENSRLRQEESALNDAMTEFEAQSVLVEQLRVSLANEQVASKNLRTN